MAPTVCLAEFPMAGGTVNEYFCRRQRIQYGMNIKRRKLALERMLQTGTISEILLTFRQSCPRKTEYTNTPDCSAVDKNRKLSINTDEHCRRLVAVRKDLLNIIVRTIILVRRNRILQKRVNALRAETRTFLRSVMNNPENQCRQQTTQPEGEIVSSSMDDEVVSTSSPLLGPDRSENSFQGVTSTCDNHDLSNEHSPDKSDGSIRSEC